VGQYLAPGAAAQHGFGSIGPGCEHLPNQCQAVSFGGQCAELAHWRPQGGKQLILSIFKHQIGLSPNEYVRSSYIFYSIRITLEGLLKCLSTKSRTDTRHA
jgi:hypothetical protein